jgi:hypothetical protein
MQRHGGSTLLVTLLEVSEPLCCNSIYILLRSGKRIYHSFECSINKSVLCLQIVIMAFDN